MPETYAPAGGMLDHLWERKNQWRTHGRGEMGKERYGIFRNRRQTFTTIIGYTSDADGSHDFCRIECMYARAGGVLAEAMIDCA